MNKVMWLHACIKAWTLLPIAIVAYYPFDLYLKWYFDLFFESKFNYGQTKNQFTAGIDHFGSITGN